MPITGVSKYRFDQEFKARPGTDGTTIHSGRNSAAPKLVATSRKLREVIERFDKDMLAIRENAALSDVGKGEQRAARISAFHLEAQQLRMDATAHSEALNAEVTSIRSQTSGLYAPKDAGDKMEAVELRNVLRSMPGEQRSLTIVKAVADRDAAMLRALSNVPSWDTSILGNVAMRRIVAEAIDKAELDALDGDDRVAIENAQSLSEIAGRKVRAFDDETRRIMEGR